MSIKDSWFLIENKLKWCTKFVRIFTCVLLHQISYDFSWSSCVWYGANTYFTSFCGGNGNGISQQASKREFWQFIFPHPGQKVILIFLQSMKKKCLWWTLMDINNSVWKEILIKRRNNCAGEEWEKSLMLVHAEHIVRAGTVLKQIFFFSRIPFFSDNLIIPISCEAGIKWLQKQLVFTLPRDE